MVLSREWDLRFETLVRLGAVSKWYSAVGNEATTVGAASVLEPGEALLTLHRDVGALLAHAVDPAELFPGLVEASRPGSWRAGSRDYLYRLASQVLGNEEGFTGGFDRSYHFGCVDPAHDHVHVGMISHLGAMIPVAAGVAWASQLRGSSRIALNFIGEGGTSTGDFHEGLNLAAVWKLPLVLVIENNRYAFSTPKHEQYACESLADRAAGYGIPGVVVDGTRVDEVERAVRVAAERARRGEGPTLIEARLGRLRGHSEQDRSLDVVPPLERREDLARDPLELIEKSCVSAGFLDEPGLESLRTRARDLVVEVTEAARRGRAPQPGPALATRPVFQVCSEVTESRPSSGSGTGITYLEAIRGALDSELAGDGSVVLLGQDIAEFGGAFGVTRGLLERHGRQRVRNTPIAESGTIGLAIGAALMGLRPVVEMQFADFISCGFNQIVNVAAKNYFRWQHPVPLVIRCPAGGGTGAGPFHSQCPEAWFTHVPGLKVVFPARPSDAAGLLREAIRDPNPVLFFEHKYLYRRTRQTFEDHPVHRVPLGRARVARSGELATIITYGWMVEIALEAARELARRGLEIEVIDLRTLVPLDRELFLESVRRTSRVLVLHEAPGTGGFGGEIASIVADEAFESLDAPVRRLSCADTPIPSHPALEAACLPGVRSVIEALSSLLEY